MPKTVRASDARPALAAFARYAGELAAATSAAVDRLGLSRRRLVRTLREVEAQLTEADRALKGVEAELQDVLARLDAGAAPAPRLTPVRVLSVDGRRRLTLDGRPLEIRSFDTKRRWLTAANLGGRLLLDVTARRSLEAWSSDDLAKAIQQVRRCELIGRAGLGGRGRGVRLEFGCRLGPALKRRPHGRARKGKL